MSLSFARILAIALIAGVPLAASAQVQGQWTSTGPLQTARELQAQVRLANGEALAIGGIDAAGNVLASAETFNPATKSWSFTGSMASARYYAPAVVLANGKVLVTGGLDNGGVVLGTAEIYDRSTGTWSPAGTLSPARYAHTATLLANGDVLVTGGCTASACATVTGASAIYHPASNTWSTTGSLGTPRYRHTAVRLASGRILVAGGIAGTVTATSELYDPASGSWAAAASMNAARYQHTTTLLPDGLVLVTGGVVSKYPLKSAEIYDPAANAWTLTGQLTNARYGHTATLLGDGTVVIAGGIGQAISCGRGCIGYIPTARSELFTEATGTFAATSNLTRAQAYHAATLVGDGQALAAGGEGFNATCCVVLADAGSYAPLTMAFSPSSLKFGVLQIGLQSPPRTVTVSNVSTHAATIASIASSGDFAQANDCPASLAAGQSCTIRVRFHPAQGGTRKGTITLRDNDPGSPSQAIPLSGVGAAQALSFQPASLDFGGVTVGQSATKSATLINDGAAPVAISGISVSSGGTTYVQTNNCPATLAVQQTCAVQVTFTPPDVFTYATTVTVSNSTGSPAALNATGQGVDGGGG